MPGCEIRLFLACAGAQARSWAVVFTNIRAAFHRVLPGLALGPILHQEQRSMLLIRAGVLETRVADVGRFVVQEDGHLKRHGLTALWRFLAVERHTCFAGPLLCCFLPDTRRRRSGTSGVCTCICCSRRWQAVGLCVVSHFRSFWFGCA